MGTGTFETGLKYSGNEISLLSTTHSNISNIEHSYYCLRHISNELGNNLPQLSYTHTV